MFKSIIVLFTLMCLLSSLGHAQSVVLSEDSIPLAGVSVTTNRGEHTVSDEEGRYSIHVRTGDTVLLRMIGYLPAKYIATKDLDVKRYLRQQPMQLTGVNIIRYNYLRDSMAMRHEYNSEFNFRRPKWYEVYQITAVNINQLYNATSFKKNRKKDKFKRALLNKEQENYVNRSFNTELVYKMTHFQGDTLVEFMQLYRPTYEFVKGATEYDMMYYIFKSREDYKLKKPL